MEFTLQNRTGTLYTESFIGLLRLFVVEYYEDGRIAIPPDVFTEYHFTKGKKDISITDSKKSGGFGLTTLELLKNSPLTDVLTAYPELFGYQIPEGDAIQFKSKI